MSIVPPKSSNSKYKQNIRNYMLTKCRWDKLEAIKWLNANEDILRQMLAAEASYRETAIAITEMEQKVNAKS